MSQSFLDKAGLSYLWSKIKAYIASWITTSEEIVLNSNSWSDNMQTITVQGINSDPKTQLIILAASSQIQMDSIEQYGLTIRSTSENSLTIKCVKVPTTNIELEVAIMPLRS